MHVRDQPESSNRGFHAPLSLDHVEFGRLGMRSGKPKTLYQGVLAYEEESGRLALCWLRLLSRSGRPLAVILTDVPNNPGRSVVNGLEGFASAVRNQVVGNRGDCDWFVSWISEVDSEESSFIRVRFLNADNLTEPDFFQTGILRRELEAFVGARLPDLPLPELLTEAVLAAGGQLEDEGEWRQEYRIMLVSDLPPPHNPSRCVHSARFDKMVKLCAGSGCSPGEMFITSLTPDDFSKCPYHVGNWREVASVSVAIIEALGPDPENEQLQEAISDSALGKREKNWLYCLFHDPIVASPVDGFTNGQHRACAVRASGAERVVVGE